MLPSFFALLQGALDSAALELFVSSDSDDESPSSPEGAAQAVAPRAATRRKTEGKVRKASGMTS